jgi:hypothetical protein
VKSTDLWTPPERKMSPDRVSQRREHLLRELSCPKPAAVPPLMGSRQRTRRRRGWAAFVLAPAALLILGAAYTIVARHAEEVVNGIGCYATADLGANTAVAQGDGRAPVAVCEGLWRQGAVVSGVTQAPPLVACVPVKGGAVWVFPGDSRTCGRLGLAPLPRGYQSAARDFAAMRNDLVVQFGRQSCRSYESARELVWRVLDAHGFDDWRVQDDSGAGGVDFSSDHTCANLSFDPGTKTVILVAGPGLTSASWGPKEPTPYHWIGGRSPCRCT